MTRCGNYWNNGMQGCFLERHGIKVEGIIDSLFSSDRVNKEGIQLLPPQKFVYKDNIIVIV